MAVEADEYELPLAVADTAREIAELFDTTAGCVQVLVDGGYSGRKIGKKFVKVLKDD